MSESLRLQVILRIKTILAAIVAGNPDLNPLEYWYTPAVVVTRLLDIERCSAFPVYMVFPFAGGPITSVGPDRYDEDMEIIIKAYVKDANDPVTMLERCLRDIRKAINADARSGVAGSLGTLASSFEFPASPEMEFTTDGFGGFDQRLRVKITGPFGTL